MKLTREFRFADLPGDASRRERQRARREFMHGMSVANYITTLGGPCQGILQLSGSNPTLVSTGNNSTQTTPSFGYTRSVQFQLGNGATALYVDTLHNGVFSIPAGGSTADTITLSALAGTATPTTRYDVLGQATPVFGRVRAILLELLTTGDSAGNSGLTPNAASPLTVGNAASAKWVAIVNTTGTFPILNGQSYAQVWRGAAGGVVSVGVSDQLKILNADAALAAIYQIVLFGSST